MSLSLSYKHHGNQSRNQSMWKLLTVQTVLHVLVNKLHLSSQYFNRLMVALEFRWPLGIIAVTWVPETVFSMTQIEVYSFYSLEPLKDEIKRVSSKTVWAESSRKFHKKSKCSMTSISNLKMNQLLINGKFKNSYIPPGIPLLTESFGSGHGALYLPNRKSWDTIDGMILRRWCLWKHFNPSEQPGRSAWPTSKTRS